MEDGQGLRTPQKGAAAPKRRQAREGRHVGHLGHVTFSLWAPAGRLDGTGYETPVVNLYVRHRCRASSVGLHIHTRLSPLQKPWNSVTSPDDKSPLQVSPRSGHAFVDLKYQDVVSAG